MNKKTLENYNLEDFVSDESFINYCHHSNEVDTSFWHDWISSHPEKRDVVTEAVRLVNKLSIHLTQDEFAEQLDKIKREIRGKSPFTVKSIPTWDGIGHRRRRIRRAAAVLTVLLIVVGFAFFLSPFKNRGENRIVSQVVSSGKDSVKMMLNDSTMVTLFPNSSLRYPASFSGKQREVYLSGGAHFHVKRNEHFPFRVHAKDLVTTVLGTIFNIKPSGDSAMVVELLQGRVKVEVADSSGLGTAPLFLKPHEKAIYIFRNKSFFKSEAVAVSDITFRQDDFDEIARKIRESFRISVINKSDRKDWRFTGEFRNSSAEEIIANICLIKNLHYSVSGDTIIITN